jgi:hypothetical protein
MTQEKRNSISNLMVLVGLLLMVVMAVLPLFLHHLEGTEWMRWGYTAGALTVLAARLIGHDNNAPLRIKRLHRILIFSGLLYCASATVMFMPDISKNWIAFLMAGLFLQIYASWMIDRESGKTEK